MNADHRRAIVGGMSAQAQRSAENRRCPGCNRGGGLGRAVVTYDGPHDGARHGVHVSRVCRYCGYVRSTDPERDGSNQGETP